MTWGVRVWGPTGNIELDENSFTVRVEFSVIVQRIPGEGRVRFISVPGIAAATHSAVCIPVAPYSTHDQNVASIQYTPIIVAGGINLYFGHPNGAGGSPMGTVPQRLLVMRYR